MPGDNNNKTWVALLIGAVVAIITQVRMYLVKSKLAKATAKADTLEQKIKQDRKDAAVQEVAVKAVKIKRRIDARQKNLEELYAKIGLLDSRHAALSDGTDASVK